MLCLGSVTKIAVPAHRCFSCCRAALPQSQGLPSSSCCPASEGVGVPQELEGTQPGQLAPNDQRDIPHHGDAHQWQLGERRRQGSAGGGGICLPKAPPRGEPCCPGGGWRLPAGGTGRRDSLLCFALPVCAAFALPGKLSLSHPMSPRTFPSLILSPIPPGESERAAGWCPAAHGQRHKAVA